MVSTHTFITANREEKGINYFHSIRKESMPWEIMVY